MKRTFLAVAILLSSALSAAPIPFRGVVEGYYGRPWGKDGRITLLNYMGKLKMNTFIYGPKDDPYHHGKWRELYPEDQIADFKEVLAVAKQNRVVFYWAIHLGGTFRRGDEGEYVRMFAKFDQLYAAGVRGFAVFFDDFGGADAAFHAEICNRIQKEYLDKKGPIAPLIVCPHVYWGSGHVYQKTLGAELDKRINIMWTGGGICSDIRAADVEKITRDFQRPPFIWWNWPVNDYCRSKLLLGRTYGLEPCELAGFVSNPMENCEANKLALYGIAKWCLDPENFKSEETWEKSFAKIYKQKEVAKAMRIFAEHNSDQGPNGHGYRKEESVGAAPLCAKAREELKARGELTSETEASLKALFTEIGKASVTLLKMLPLDQGLGWEIEGWLRAEQHQMAMGLKTLELYRAKTTKERKKLLADLKKIRAAAEKAIEAHKTKFAAATFSGDKNHINAPVASNRELKPLIEGMLEKKLRDLYRAKTGEEIESKDGFTAFASFKAGETLETTLEGRAAGLKRTLEPKVVPAGGAFGFKIPEAWQSEYFHARFDSFAPVGGGVIEVSRDGLTWEKLETENQGREMKLKLNPAKGYRAVRYRNTSSGALTLKIELFKFDVRGNLSPIDSLLREL